MSYIYDDDSVDDDESDDAYNGHRDTISEYVYDGEENEYDDRVDDEYEHENEAEDEDGYISDSVAHNHNSRNRLSNNHSDVSWVDDSNDVSDYDQDMDMDTDIKVSDIEELMSDAKAFLSRSSSAPKPNRHYLLNKADFIGHHLSKALQQKMKSSQLTIEDACINTLTRIPHVILSCKKASKTITIHTKLNFDEMCMGVVLSNDEIHNATPTVNDIDEFLACRVDSSIMRNGVEQQSFSSVRDLLTYLVDPHSG